MDPSSPALESPTLASVPPSLDLAAHTSVRSHANGAKIARISEKPAALKAEWNNTAPVNSLPNELFVEIFLLAEPCSVGNCGRTTLPDTVSWAPLMLVCRHWRDVILSTPRLWRVVKAGKDLRWMALAVSRSQNATLDITFSCDSPVLSSHPILLPVAQRVAALEFDSMDEGQLAAALDVVDCTHSGLVNLRLTRAHWERGAEAPWRGAFPNPPLHSVSFDRQRFPAMTTLAIEGVRMVLKDSQAFLSRLRVLDVQRCVLLCDPPIFALSTFLDMLASCSSLEEVRLSGMLRQFHRDLESQGQPGRARHGSRTCIVSIPKLRSLTLSDEAGVVSGFMSYLHVPPNVDVHLVSELDSLTQDTPALFLPLLPQNRRQTLPILNNVRNLYVLFDIMSNMFSLNASSDTEGAGLRLSLAVERDHRMSPGLPLFRALNETKQLYAHVPLTDVTVDVAMNTLVLEEAEWAPLLAAFRAVENFAVRSLCIDALNLFAALAQPQPGSLEDGGSITAVCPRMRTLCVHGPFWSDATLECIVGCLAARARGGATSLEKLELELSFMAYKEFEGAKRAFLSGIGAVFAGEVEFGFDSIEALETGTTLSDDEGSDEDDDDYGSDDDD
ncbi:hypothetical protein GSI_03346 [Ganoderma sinense ZZ0214-1]|uniref:F-box domain-containing protein n=1 Tax=Ganoderma sinense ZZ0214-1 TaxID=1077348 RepID=A0A2G8SLW6_9APHY|nr:hypothetical protein GSI_03346 [Ganoderma sinense ZZ0214-1]